MIREHEVRALADLGQWSRIRDAQRIDIPRVVIIVVGRNGTPQPSPTLQGPAGAIEHRARRRRTILRYKGSTNSFLMFSGTRTRGREDAGLPLGHAEFDADLIDLRTTSLHHRPDFCRRRVEYTAKCETLLSQILRVPFAVRMGETAVSRRTARATKSGRRVFDDATVAQEFAQVALNAK